MKVKQAAKLSDLPFDYCRCTGNFCKVKESCQRFCETKHNPYGQAWSNMAQDTVESKHQCLFFIDASEYHQPEQS